MTGKRSFAATLNGASRIAVTFPLSSMVRCAIFSSRSGTAHCADGARWTNEQLLFHMLFGYIIVRAIVQALFGGRPGTISVVARSREGTWLALAAGPGKGGHR